MDASSLGKKVKDGKNQRTVLSDEEVNRIIDVFTNRKVEDDFSVSVPYNEMTEKGYSFSAGQYFEVKSSISTSPRKSSMRVWQLGKSG